MVLSLPLRGKSCIISLLSPLFSVTKNEKKKSSFPFMSVKGKIQEDRPGFIIPIPLKKISREILYVLLGQGTDFPSRRQKWTVFLWTVVGNHCTDSCNSFDPPRAKSKLCLHQRPRGDAGEPSPFPFPSLFSCYHTCTHWKYVTLYTYITLKIKHHIQAFLAEFTSGSAEISC